ncbi:MAG TPA: hypothetical protein VFW07_01385 [Parafilimonas sp.]|nr:hypothetical protein [Parafilimonas sp.]
MSNKGITRKMKIDLLKKIASGQKLSIPDKLILNDDIDEEWYLDSDTGLLTEPGGKTMTEAEWQALPEFSKIDFTEIE